jgi:DNA-binding sugar fermentation-stimulating protein
MSTTPPLRRKRKKAPTHPRRKLKKVRKKTTTTTTTTIPSIPHDIAAFLKMKVGATEVVRAATTAYATAVRPLLLDLGRANLVRATFVCRPSKRNRSPYVADVLLADGREAIAHVPCMDMGGKCIPGAQLLLKIARDRKGVPVGANVMGKFGTPKCEFITQLLWNDESQYQTWIAAHPALGEKLVECIAAGNLLGESVGRIDSFEREVRNICGANMRTDFVLSHPDGSRSVMEVKTVVDTDVSPKDAAARYAEHRDELRRVAASSSTTSEPTTTATTAKKKKKKQPKDPILFISKKEPYVRAGIFPWGSCKQKGPDGEKVVSARAIKHVDELNKIASGELKEENDEILKAAVLFLVGRQDVELFRPNVEGCASFAKHLAQAKAQGVQVVAHKIIWGENEDEGKAYWGGELPVEL